MPSCHSSAGSARPFVISEYVDHGGEAPEPCIPRVGPCCGSDGGAARCDVVCHLWRERKTGPGFPVLVMRCRAHGRCFTVYPPGHVPYGRRSLVPVGFDGSPVRTEAGEAPGYEGSLFEAASDAAMGRSWGEGAVGGGATRSHQAQLLKRGALLLGVTAGSAPAVLATASEVLDVDLLLLAEQQARLAGVASYVEHGAALMAVLRSMRRDRCQVERLAEAGYQAGLWGRPYRWDGQARVLRSMPFRGAGTRASGGAPSG